MTAEKSVSRHRADTSATTKLPRPLRRVVGAGGLALVLAGSLAFAATQSDEAEQEPFRASVDSAADMLANRTTTWDQASRSGQTSREAAENLLDEAGPSVTFSVTVDGDTYELTSNAETVADALTENGIVVGFEDKVSVDLNSRPTEDLDITIERVGTHYGTETESMPFETTKKKTDALPEGTTEVDTEGEKGSRVIAYTAEYRDGEEVSRTVQTEIVVSEAVDEVVLVGTGTQPESEPATETSDDSSSESAPEAPAPEQSGSSPKTIAQELLASRGWSGQWSCLNSLWERESGWNPQAQNPSSGAYGIPQSLPGSKMASAGSDWQTNPATQITWGLNYIAGRYGGPCGAWSHSQATGWY